MGPDGGPRKGTMRKCLKGEDGRPIGRGHHNPFLDTQKYKVDIDGIPMSVTRSLRSPWCAVTT